MHNNKKPYESPKVTIHGTVQDLTLKGGGHYIDLPKGTPVTSVTTIADVTSGV